MTKKAFAVIISFLPLTLVLAQEPASGEGSFLEGLMSLGALIVAMVGLIFWHRMQQKSDSRRRADQTKS